MSQELNFKQELVGCFGYPVAENPTQAMIEPAFRALGLDWRYLTLEVKPGNLPAAVAGARAFGFQGFNCTIPHKVAVIEHLDGLGESAALMGAVNCVVNREGKLIGENTDGKGFVSSFRELADPKGQSMLLLGAGGAARAIGVEMALAGVRRITVANRSEERGRELETLLRGPVNEAIGGGLEVEFQPWTSDLAVPDGTGIVVNATSIGLFPDVDARVALDVETLTSDMVVADVIPNPPKTRLVLDATERSCQVIDGLGM
ncbi:MAG: shikimate dehydrogenase, partial [Verrucomicrobiae bacterium]|nr:shikimate dehydrogenase [Verrucomicrobiae bacterium]